MSAQHMPPLPWKVNENAEPNQWYITSGDRKWVIGLSMNGEMFPERQKAVLDRIVACVSACDGIDTELLQPRMLGDQIAAKMAVIDRSESEARQLKVQRDDLLAALSEYIAAADNSVNPDNGDDVAAMVRFGVADKAARAAIAKAARP